MIKKFATRIAKFGFLKNVRTNGYSRLYVENVLRDGFYKQSPSYQNYSEQLVQDNTLNHAIRKAQDALLSRQKPEGYWEGELYADTTLTSDYILMTHFLKSVNLSRQMKAVHFIFNNQQPDGSWNIFFGGAGDLNATVKAYFALKLAGISPNDARMLKAKQFIINNGGIEGINIFSKIYLSMFGQYDWNRLPSMPVEMMLVPNFFFFNVYEISCWSRDIVVPLFIISAYKPVIPIPSSSFIDELKKNGNGKQYHYDHENSLWGRTFIFFDKFVKFCGHFPVVKPIRKLALHKARKWLVKHLKGSDGVGAIYPAMLNSVLALHLLGYDKHHPVMKKMIRTLDELIEENDRHLYLKPCLSPVWDTAFTLKALVESGVPARHPALVKSVKWILDKQTTVKGDWAIKRPNLSPGGWYFQFANNFYPDNDDTAVVLMALRHFINITRDTPFTETINGNVVLGKSTSEAVAPEMVQESIRKGLMWIMGMQCKDGGWSAFEPDNNKTMLNNLPWADYGALLDPSTADVTGRVLQVLGYLGYTVKATEIRSAIEFLKKIQEPEGPWYGRWGVNYIYGTWSALMGLASVGEDMNAPYVKKAIDWMLSKQKPDGSWGETCLSYSDRSLMGSGEGTPSQTSWALLTLMAAGLFPHDAIDKGVDYLLKTQQYDGLWNGDVYTGTGFPQVLYLRYEFYSYYFPIMALSEYRYLQQCASKVKIL